MEKVSKITNTGQWVQEVYGGNWKPGKVYSLLATCVSGQLVIFSV